MVLTLTAGAIFVMWLGEQITERGIGNGMSLLITVSILERLWPGSLQLGSAHQGRRGLAPSAPCSCSPSWSASSPRSWP